jgi:hypothetical protein
MAHGMASGSVNQLMLTSDCGQVSQLLSRARAPRWGKRPSRGRKLGLCGGRSGGALSSGGLQLVGQPGQLRCPAPRAGRVGPPRPPRPGARAPDYYRRTENYFTNRMFTNARM